MSEGRRARSAGAAWKMLTTVHVLWRPLLPAAPTKMQNPVRERAGQGALKFQERDGRGDGGSKKTLTTERSKSD